MPPTIRPLTSEADYEACLTLQRATWGDDFRELVPPTILMIAQKAGGIAAGAFEDNGALVGFVFGLTGIRDGRPMHWSHMLAVRADRRDHGIGSLLKRWQAERLRVLSVRSMFWTYDPLGARNAHLNLNHLGAHIVEYVRDMYGTGTRSTTDAVIGSDRAVVEWKFGSKERRRASGRRKVLRRIPIPVDIQTLKQADPDRARQFRAESREAFETAFTEGLAIIGFERTDDGGAYLVGRP